MNKLSGMCIVVVLVLTAATMAGCATAQPSADSIEGTWVLESFGGTKALVPANATITTEMTLSGGKVTGRGGVNSFSGTYTAKNGGSLVFSPLTATLMAGPPAAAKQEQEFFSAIERTRSFELNHDKLLLGSRGNDTLAVLKRK